MIKLSFNSDGWKARELELSVNPIKRKKIRPKYEYKYGLFRLIHSRNKRYGLPDDARVRYL